MNLMILFGQRKESYPGEHAPEPLLCWSEYEVDENPKGFMDAVEAAKAKAPETDFEATRLIQVTVPQDLIRDLIIGKPTVVARHVEAL